MGPFVPWSMKSRETTVPGWGDCCDDTAGNCRPEISAQPDAGGLPGVLVRISAPIGKETSCAAGWVVCAGIADGMADPGIWHLRRRPAGRLSDRTSDGLHHLGTDCRSSSATGIFLFLETVWGCLEHFSLASEKIFVFLKLM